MGAGPVGVTGGNGPPPPPAAVEVRLIGKYTDEEDPVVSEGRRGCMDDSVSREGMVGGAEDKEAAEGDHPASVVATTCPLNPRVTGIPAVNLACFDGVSGPSELLFCDMAALSVIEQPVTTYSKCAI